MNKSEDILKELAYLERYEGIHILYAVEAGSRAWGFDSMDSDYDVRFIYRRNISDYLRLEGRRDTIEHSIGLLDMAGWDLDKSLRLMRKSNPSFFEWLGSPIVYREDANWILVRKMAMKCHNPVTTAYHHIGMARSTMRERLKGDMVPAKGYLYAIRSAFAAEWVLKHFEPVPVPFVTLFEDQKWWLRDSVSDKIADLLNLKRNDPENAKVPRDHDLERWLEGSLQGTERTIDQYRYREPPAWQEIDDLYLKMLGLKAF